MIQANRTKTIPTHQIFKLQYRNAVYQGGYEIRDQTLSNNGLVYFHKSKCLMGCTTFVKNQLNGPSFFIYDAQNYQYGEWKNNCPYGISIFRLKDTFAVVSFENGIILQGSKIVLILQTYNIGVILQYKFGSWLIGQKSEIYCHEQIERLLSKCKLNNQVYLSLLKFINNKFNVKSSQIKLRYIGQEYRFGFQNGMAIFFNELQRIICFQTFDDQKQKNKSPTKAGHVYNLSTYKQIKLINKIFQDPSEQHFNSMKALVNEEMIKAILSGFIKDKAFFLQKSRILKSQSHSIEIKTIKSSRKQSNMYEASPIKSKTIKQSNVESQSLSEFSAKKEQFLKNHLKNHQSKSQSPQKQKVKKYLDQIDRISILLNRPKENVKRLNLLPEGIQIIKIQQQPQQISSFGIIEQPQSPNILKEKQQAIGITSQKPEIEKEKEQEQDKSKSKKKIFDQISKYKNHYQFSPITQKDIFHNKNRLKIFSPEERNEEKQTKNHHKEEFQVNSCPDDKLSSPIHRLNSNAFTIDKQAMKKHEQKFLSHSSQPKITHLNTDSVHNEIRALTQFQCQSSRIVSEDMSNLQQLTMNKSLQINDSPLKKLKRLNQIYKDDRKTQIQQPKGKIYGNQPYIQRDINSQTNSSSNNRKIINSMRTKSKSNRYQNL